MSESCSRDSHVEALAREISGHAEALVAQMVQELADLPEEELFGDIEFRLRDLALELSRRAQQSAVDQNKKRGTRAPVASARTARTMPVSRATLPGKS